MHVCDLLGCNVSSIQSELKLIFVLFQQEEWDKHGEKLSRFIMTKANPPIFYLPAKLNDKTQKLLEESTRAVKSKSIDQDST